MISHVRIEHILRGKQSIQVEWLFTCVVVFVAPKTNDDQLHDFSELK